MVFDAGRTEHGRPYFVMELVKGTPITQFCDEHKLTPKERLEFFLPVFEAIQHSHQKGIIDAPRLSAKLSSIDTLPSVAANRKTEPRKLANIFRGELDWVRHFNS